jgi:hypothetical protein
MGTSDGTRSLTLALASTWAGGFPVCIYIMTISGDRTPDLTRETGVR